jgi:hypothetical protein
MLPPTFPKSLEELSSFRVISNIEDCEVILSGRVRWEERGLCFGHRRGDRRRYGPHSLCQRV